MFYYRLYLQYIVKVFEKYRFYETKNPNIKCLHNYISSIGSRKLHLTY